MDPMGMITAAAQWAVEHPVEIAVCWWAADKVVRWTPWVEDDEIVALVGRGLKKLFGRHPSEIVGK